MNNDQIFRLERDKSYSIGISPDGKMSGTERNPDYMKSIHQREKEESEWKRDLDFYTHARISKKHPEDEGQEFYQIRVKVSMAIKDHWYYQRQLGRYLDPPFMDMI